jgi:hypothetical protein
MAHAVTHRTINTDQTDERDERSHGREHAVVDRERLRAEFGGFHFGSAFFGWLVATGLGTLLMGFLAAAGSAIAVTSIKNTSSVSSGTVSTVGLVSGILLLIALAISYYAGGYVAGRMARFNGARQGFGAWLLGIILALILGGLGAAFGAKYNLVQQLNLPHLPINQGSFTTGGIIASIAAVLVTLAAAMMGGKQGEHFHNKIDDAGQVDTVEL